MAEEKYFKLGAAIFLSAGMLAACGDGDDDSIEVDDPSRDTDIEEEEKNDDAPVIDDGGLDTEDNGSNTDEELEEETDSETE